MSSARSCIIERRHGAHNRQSRSKINQKVLLGSRLLACTRRRRRLNRIGLLRTFEMWEEREIFEIFKNVGRGRSPPEPQKIKFPKKWIQPPQLSRSLAKSHSLLVVKHAVSMKLSMRSLSRITLFLSADIHELARLERNSVDC